MTKTFEMLDLLGESPRESAPPRPPTSPATRSRRPIASSAGSSNRGHAHFDARTKIYTLGMEVFRLAQKVAHRRGLSGATKELLRELTETTGESSILAIRRGNAALTVLTVDGPQFRTTTDPGDESPLHTSSLGQALLAHDPNADATIEALDLVARTPNSITDPAKMRSRLERIRTDGWAGQSEENDIGMNALAVPVFDLDGTLLASLALAAPVFRRTLDELIDFVPQLTETAAAIAARFPR